MKSLLDLQAQTIADVKNFKKEYDGTVAVIEEDSIAINQQAVSLSEQISVLFKHNPTFRDELQNDIKRISKTTTGRTVRRTHGLKNLSHEELI